MSGRERPIKLNGEYIIHWEDYSDLGMQNGKFRYLLIEIKHDNGV